MSRRRDAAGDERVLVSRADTGTRSDQVFTKDTWYADRQLDERRLWWVVGGQTR